MTDMTGVARLRAQDRFFRALRRWQVAAPLLLIGLAGLYASALRFQDWQADRHYRQAEAEADRLDPGWRLDHLMAGLEVLPDSANSAVALKTLAGRLPSSWPGIVLYDHAFLDPGRPDLRLDPARLAEIRTVYEPGGEFASEARKLAGMPRGQFRGPRPGVERLEQVAGFNALRDSSFPYGEDVRRVVMLLWLDGLIAVEEGRFEAAILDARAMIGAGRSIGDYPKLSAQQSRQGASLMAISLLERVLSQGEVKDDTLASLQSLLEGEAKHPSVMISLRGERAVVDDLLQDIRSGRATTASIPNYDDYGWWERGFTGRSTLRANQASLLRFHTQGVEIGKLAEGEQVAAMKSLGTGWTSSNSRRNFFERAETFSERLLLGRSAGIPLWTGGHLAALRAAALGLAAERYRLGRGRWPDSPQALTPAWISVIPTDPLSRGPIKFRGFPDGIFFYSTGYDGVDDGGKLDWKRRMGPGSDPGFRLWDVDRRRRAPATDQPED